MYYPNQNNYMQDLNYYNQVNPNFQPQSMISNNSNMIPNQYNAFPMNQYQCNGFMQGANQNNNFNQVNSLEGMYPCIYRIINPVIERVIDGSYARNQLITEDNLNNMVDTVFNIVDGQLEKEDLISKNNASSENNQEINRSNNLNQTRANNTLDREEVNSERKRNNSLIQDIIKILIIQSLISRNNQYNFQNFPNNQFMNMMQQPNFF